MMPSIVYFSCAAMSTLCALMLIRVYSKNSNRLLLWCGICFTGLALNNILLFVDLIILPKSIDLQFVRTIPAVIGVMFLLYGLIEDTVT